jgi:hypothetical protein
VAFLKRHADPDNNKASYHGMPIEFRGLRDLSQSGVAKGVKSNTSNRSKKPLAAHRLNQARAEVSLQIRSMGFLRQRRP